MKRKRETSVHARWREIAFACRWTAFQFAVLERYLRKTPGYEVSAIFPGGVFKTKPIVSMSRTM